MSKENFDELKIQVTEFVNEKPVESLLIAAAALAVGFMSLKYLWKWNNKPRDKPTDKPEDVIQIEEETKGNLSGNEEETKSRSRKFILQSDSEDEPMLLKQAIRPMRDGVGVLDRGTLVRIFDKRSTIRGIRRLDRTFKEKRRANFEDANEYK